MDIDIRTIALFYFIANVMNNGLLFIIWRMYRKHFRGLSFLFADMCLQTMGSLFLLLRGALPEIASIVFTNLFSVFGLICLFIGLELFFDLYKPRIYVYFIFALYMAVIVYFSALQDNLFVRNILLSSSIVFYTGLSSIILIRQRNKELRSIARFTTNILLVYSLTSIVRIFALVCLPQQSNEFFTSGLVNSIAMIAYSILNILITAGLIMMVSQRVLNEVQTEKDKYIKAFNSSPYAMLLTKVTDGKIFEVNEGFVRMSGYQPEEVIGKTTLEVGLWIDPDDRREFVRDLINGDVHEREVKFRIKDDSFKTCLISATIISTLGEECILTSVNDISEMNQIRKKLEVMALHDALTGLPNRQLFYDRADVAFANARRNKSSVAVVSLDVDRLKSINDQWGHPAGDFALVSVSSRLQNLLRESDTVSRFGGDEFLILLDGVQTAEDIHCVAKKMIDSVSEPIYFAGHSITISASVGIAVYPNDGMEIEELIRKSDEAMYYIKEHGRNGYKFYCDIEHE
ncbi:MAG TPA: sensor domain-containing diguanylate cyclase [Candidatus Cryosericum sp.]|nr:sensor domain-containing diguanylate cyclase [Candidatus Cryosericum sp.]